jgi:hypothetical protein
LRNEWIRYDGVERRGSSLFIQNFVESNAQVAKFRLLFKYPNSVASLPSDGAPLTHSTTLQQGDSYRHGVSCSITNLYEEADHSQGFEADFPILVTWLVIYPGVVQQRAREITTKTNSSPPYYLSSEGKNEGEGTIYS